MILFLLLKQRKEVIPKDINRLAFVKTHDLGQHEQSPDMGYPDTITPDEIEWAREQGARTDNEILDMIHKHRNEESL